MSGQRATEEEILAVEREMDDAAPLGSPGPCRKCHRPRDVLSPTRGAYANLCRDCRSEVARGRAARPSSSRATPPPGPRVDLAEIAKKVVPAARRFQTSIERRHDARREAQAALGELSSALREIRDAAQKLAAAHEGNTRVEAELDKDDD